MKNKFLAFLFLLIVFTACKATKGITVCETFSKAITSKEFSDVFREVVSDSSFVLYKFDVADNVTSFYFFDTLSNAVLQLGYNWKGRLVIINSGVF